MQLVETIDLVQREAEKGLRNAPIVEWKGLEETRTQSQSTSYLPAFGVCNNRFPFWFLHNAEAHTTRQANSALNWTYACACSSGVRACKSELNT